MADRSVEGGGTKKENLDWKDIGASVATYIGIPVVIAYPVGLFVLAAQLYANYGVFPLLTSPVCDIPPETTFKFPTAWYAAYLAAPSVAGGQGAKVLLVPLVYGMIVALVVAQLFIAHDEVEGEGWRTRSRQAISAWIRSLGSSGNKGRSILMLVTILSLLLILVAPVVWSLLVILDDPSKILHRGLFFILPLFIMGVVGGIILSADGASKPRLLTWFQLPARSWLNKYMVVAYLVSLSFALLAASTQYPALPRIEMERIVDGSDKSTINGLFLSHSNGYWHVLFSNPTSNSCQRFTPTNIVSIPNDQASDVRIIR